MSTLASFLLFLMLHVQLHELLCNPVYTHTYHAEILCPDENRYNVETKSCQKLGERGSCGELMIFLADSDNTTIGECDCDFSKKEPLVYHEVTKRCYSTYTRAYCEERDWLVPVGRPPDVKFQCMENKCLTHSLANNVNFTELQRPHIVLYKGSCTTMFSKCSESGQVAFHQEHPFPGCGQVFQSTDIQAHSIAPSRLRCRPGSRRNILTGKCKTTYHIASKPSV